MKAYDKLYEKWWMKYIIFPLLVGGFLLFLGLILGPGISIDNSNSVSSPVFVESPNSTVNYLEGKDSLLREYSYIAALNLEGSEFRAGRGLTLSGGLPNLMKDVFIEDGDQVRFKCGPEFQEIYKEVIEIEPKFPFSYFALADCRKLLGKDDWVEYAEKAVKILQITTQIAGHKAEHDQVLEILLEYLRE